MKWMFAGKRRAPGFTAALDAACDELVPPIQAA